MTTPQQAGSRLAVVAAAWVVLALVRLLNTFLSTADAERRWPAIETQAGLLAAAADRGVAEPAAVVHAEADAPPHSAQTQWSTEELHN